MASSQALIHWEPVSNNGTVMIQENLRPEGGRWALILNAFLSPSPGRTLDQVYTAVGKVLETQANHFAYKLGLGPHVIAGKIKSYFGNGEHRMQQLELLQTTVPPELKKQCLKLMKYSLPTKSADTQCQAFKEVVDLATLLPGLRVLFLQTKILDSAISLDTISALWDRSTDPLDKEWTFWQALAATCLADTVISAMTEGNSLADLVACHHEGLSIIEQLLVEHDCGVSNYASALCLRYLAGVLDLPGFWQNSGSAHAQVADKLCCRMVRVLKDIGVDIPSLGPIEAFEAPLDYDGVDFLGTTLLNGLSNWFGKLDRGDWAVQPWYESFAQVLWLLREPRAAELLPFASTSATTSFENILPTSYQDRVLNVMVDNQNTIPGDRATPAANHSTNNLSAHSIDSDTNQESSGQSIKSPDDSPSQIFDVDSEGLSLQDEESIPNESSDFSNPMLDDTGSDLSESEEQFGMASGHGNVLEDLSNGSTGMPGISGTQTILASTSWPSLEARHKDLEEQKLILLNKQRNLGDNHPETLDAIKNLAWLHHELGEYGSARDLWVTVLEKYQILGGEDNPSALQVMHSLGVTHRALGQPQEAKKVLELALEKQRKFLGENHLETARTLSSLALTYQHLGQFNKAQELAMSAVEKHSQLLGEDYSDTLWFIILGEYHPNTLRAMGGLGMTYLASGQFTKAEDLLSVVFDTQKKVLGEEHPYTLRTMAYLASTYRELSQLSAAEELATVALEKCQKILGEDHPETLWIMGELASIFQRQGQPEHAEELLVVVLEKDRKNSGHDHPNTRWTMIELANLYHRMNKLTAAEELERLMGDQ
ncbi:hypothetical protein B0H14DRAFT_3787971 [Mycena olivaceomarginata]|nr:hypothetical protein B0H14DRAFT_3787971 [Mycena olivaceomarginata]